MYMRVPRKTIAYIRTSIGECGSPAPHVSTPWFLALCSELCITSPFFLLIAHWSCFCCLKTTFTQMWVRVNARREKRVSTFSFSYWKSLDWSPTVMVKKTIKIVFLNLFFFFTTRPFSSFSPPLLDTVDQRGEVNVGPEMAVAISPGLCGQHSIAPGRT